ncbi:hypothetical protein HT031_006292 [Scenedesmus sp. PABB004]|nr:hypothetical protein HT031_006292 [Scenedesmus sp. PABB004]
MLAAALAAARPAAHATAAAAAAAARRGISSAQLIEKWSSLLETPAAAPPPGPPAGSAESTRELRALVSDAIAVHRAEGAGGLVPDAVPALFMTAYRRLARSAEQRRALFALLACEFGVQPRAVDDAAALWAARRRDGGPELQLRLADRLASAAQPLYLQLLLPLAQHPDGIAFLVRLRGDLLALLAEQPGLEHGAALRGLAQHLRGALARWFNVGLLRLQRITWEATPGALLERVMAAEAVHVMQHVQQLKRRLQQSDRRVFAFFHPSLPEQPLVVLHTAIMDHVPATMDEVLAPQPPQEQQQQQQPGGAASNAGGGPPGSVACFYSISAGQPGLGGVDLGHFLIVRAAQALQAELPGLTRLVTLSPMPGFRAWLVAALRQEAGGGACAAAEVAAAALGAPQQPGSLLQPQEAAATRAALAALGRAAPPPSAGDGAAGAADAGNGGGATAAALLELLEADAWLALPAPHAAALQGLLARLGLVYLLTQKRRGAALDPVQHFHLKNGAMLLAVHARADLSAAGLARSVGVMCNYGYDLPACGERNSAYLLDGAVAAAPGLWDRARGRAAAAR